MIEPTPQTPAMKAISDRIVELNKEWLALAEHETNKPADQISTWDVAEEGGIIAPSRIGGASVSPVREAPISSALYRPKKINRTPTPHP
jgi:hypothetical protein